MILICWVFVAVTGAYKVHVLCPGIPPSQFGFPIKRSAFSFAVKKCVDLGTVKNQELSNRYQYAPVPSMPDNLELLYFSA